MEINSKITKKHILIFAVIVVAVAIIVTVFVLSPNLEEVAWGEPSDGLEYTYLTDITEYYIKGNGICEDKDIVIPAEYKGYPVIGIYFDAFSKCEFLESVYIPDSVNDIRSDAFAECKNLRKVRLSKNLTSIPDDMFLECEKLEKIIIPNGCKSIGDDAFAYCDNLTRVELPNTIEKIGKAAFFKSENVKIYYSGTVSEWNNIYLEGRIYDNRREIKVYCSDGTINWIVAA